jgi:putative ABC transport system substrate-binding protein
MMKPTRSVAWTAWAKVTVLATLGVPALPGCTGGGGGPPASSAAQAKVAPAQKLAVIRLGDPTKKEPIDKDIADGLKYAGLDGSSFTLVDRDAKGDLNAVPGLIDAAVADGAVLLITLLPETTTVAVGKDLKIPLVFQMTGDPVRLGLGKSGSDHLANVTGAYTMFHQSLIVPIARGCLPKVRKLGIVFNPDDRMSVMHKDELLQIGWWGAVTEEGGKLALPPVEPVTAEFHSEADLAAAVRALVEKKAEGIILTLGVGSGAKTAIAEARRAKVPVFGYCAEDARAGAIVAREVTMRWGGFEAGRQAGKVLKGQPAGQVRFTQGVDYVTYVNTGAAKDLGVTIMNDLMRSARVVTTDSR